jgi:hypothetical protein
VCGDVLERYGFASAVVLQPKGDSFTQTDIGQHIRKAIDATIKKQSRDVDADVYPQFYIEPGPRIRVYAEASNNPKQLEDTKTYYALFQGVFVQIQKNRRHPPHEQLLRKRMSFYKERPRLLAVSRFTPSRQILSKSTPMPRNHLLTKRNRFFDPMNRNSNI